MPLNPADLQGWQLFSYLSPSDLAALARIASRQEWAAGAEVFTEGERAVAFWVVLRGQVKVYKVGADGREQILRMVRAGESLAEAAALSQGAYPAHAAALGRVTAARFPAADFLRLVESSPRLAVNLIVALSHLLRNFVGLVDALSLQQVPARLAKYLLDLSARARRDEFPLDVPKTVLAARLGTVGETLSRALRRLREDGAIATDGPRVRILDRAALERVAAGE